MWTWNTTSLGTAGNLTVKCTTDQGGVNKTIPDIGPGKGTITSKVMDGLTPGNLYSCTLMAVSNGIDGDPSSAVDQPTMPNPPTGVGVETINSTSVSVSWMHVDPSTTTASFNVTCTPGTVGSETVTSTTSDGNVTEATLTGMTPGDNYTCTVQATANSIISTQGEATGKTKLGTPSSVEVTSKNTSSLVITWTGAPGLKEKYTVSCTSDSGDDFSDETSDGNNEILSCTSLTPGALYTVNVTTVKTGFEMDTCTAESCQTLGVPDPLPPVALTLGEASKQSIVISWQAPNNSIVHDYVITHNGSPASENTSTTTFTVDGLSSGTNYTISVQSRVTYDLLSGTSDNTTNSNAWTLSDAVANISITPAATSLDLAWNKPPQNTGDGIKWYKLRILDMDESATCVHEVYLHRKGETPPSSMDCNSSNVEIDSVEDVSYSNTEGIVACGNYRADLVVNNPAGDSAQTSQNATALKQAPTTKVENVAMSGVTSTSMKISWTRPLEPARCDIDSYKFQYTYRDCADNSSKTETEDNINETSYNITNLQEFWSYDIVITASINGQVGNSQSDTETFRTSEAAPGQPASVNVTETTSESIFVKWEPPVECDLNGVITSYNLTYTCEEADRPGENVIQGSITAEATDSSRNITQSLTPYKVCNLTLVANTIAPGLPVTVETQTEQSTPGPVSNSTFEFTISQNMIEIMWDEPEVRNGPIINYTVRWQELGIASQGFNVNYTDVTKFDATGLNHDTVYSFTIAAWTIIGEGELSGEGQTQTGIGKPKQVTNIIADATAFDKISVNWTKPDIRTGPTNYTIQAYDMDMETIPPISQLVPGFYSEFGIVGGLHAYIPYCIQVLAMTEAGNSSQILDENVTTLQTVPPVVDENEIRIKRTSMDECTQVTVEWEGLTGRNRSGIMTNYYIKTKPDTGTVQQPVTDQIQSAYNKIITVSPETLYTTFEIQAETEAGRGNWSVKKYQVNMPACKPQAPEGDNNTTTQTVNPLSAEDQSDQVDKTRQWTVSLQERFIYDDTQGVIMHRGIVVFDIESFTQENSQKFGSWSDLQKQYSNTWRNVKDKSIMDPYIANAPSDWKPVAGGRKKRQTDNYIQFIIGEQETCEGAVVTYCNGYIKAGRSYRIKLFTCTNGGCYMTAASPPFTTDTNPSNIGLIIGIVIPLIVIILVLASVILWRSGYFNKGHKARPAIKTGQENRGFEELELEMDKKPVSLEGFLEHANELHRDTDLRFSEEYRTLKEMSPKKSWAHAELPQNRIKNRFTNILAFDHTRVKLLPIDDDEGSDYINANYMPGHHSPREFIAAQGPLPSTKDDFWRMVWEQNVRLIVMLTNCFERGRPKCDQYWPTDGEPIFYGDLQLELKSDSVLDKHTIRIIDVTLGEKQRTIKQMHFTTWPDHGCPDKPQDLLEFCAVVRSHLPHTPGMGPILVHCSAGVGRTGTFICMDRLLHHIQGYSEIDIFGTVMEMRGYRCNMVQTEDQYIYIHDCLSEALRRGMHMKQTNGSIPLQPEEDDPDENGEVLYENVQRNGQMIQYNDSTLHEKEM